MFDIMLFWLNGDIFLHAELFKRSAEISRLKGETDKRTVRRQGSHYLINSIFAEVAYFMNR